MFPETLTEEYAAKQSPAERRVFEKARDELDDNHYVFHDIAWDDPSLLDSKTKGQIDFVIVRPDRGFICLEVKGGRCSFDAETREWHTVDGKDVRVDIRDPFDQASAAARVMVKLLRLRQGCDGFYIPSAHAAIFPDCTMPKKTIRANIHGWQILDQESLFDFAGSVDQLFERAFPGEKCDRENGMRIIRGVKHIFGVTSLAGKTSFNSRLRLTSDRLVSLTAQQVQILDALRLNDRLLVEGCAGSGKTMLAIHKAHTLAESGKRTLLTCYNIPLGRYLAQECSGIEGITAGPFLELCISWLKTIGIEVRPESDGLWWSETLPSLVADHLDRLFQRFDAIVVDEGQDFKDDHWTLIELLLEDPGHNTLYVFCDRGQNIYRGTDQYPMLPSTVVLDKNIRNTNQVWAIVRACCPPDITMLSSGVAGPVPELLEYSDDDQMRKLIERTLTRLVHDSVAASDIVLLGTKSQERTTLKYNQTIGPFRLVPEREKSTDLLSMTIQRFKGMERRVVILCEMDEDTKLLTELLYIGATRASGHLVVLAKGPLYKKLKDLKFST